MPRLFLLLALLLYASSEAFAIPAALVHAAEIHVASNGHDANPGTVEQPLATFEGARIEIAKRNLAGNKPVTVWIHEGTYYFQKPFTLGADDSGTEQAPITYRNMPGEEVVIKGSGALSPSGWEPYHAGIYQQSLKGTPLAGKEINQLFMSNKRMVRARYPNWDFKNPLRSGDGYLHATGEGGSMEKLHWEAGDLDSKKTLWKEPTEGIVHAFHKNNWGNFQFRIKNLDWENKTLHFLEGGWQAQRRLGVGVKDKHHEGSPYYIENLFEELDAPCEWYYDTNTEILYFKPPGEVSPSNVVVEAATLTRLIECLGVAHVHFEGFHLTQTRSTFLDAYEDLARGDWAIHRGGAVYFLNSQNCSVKNFHIEQVGGNGIFVDGFNREIHISGCLIEETGDSSVCFVGNPKAVRNYQTWEKPLKEITDFKPGPKTNDYPASCSVTNSILRDVGVYGKQTSGVVVSMAKDITIDHCSVYRVARAGITFNDGTWGGHVMSHCDIYDTILDTGEHGPFNAWGRERFWAGRKMDKELVLLDAIKTTKLHDNRVSNYRSGVSAGNWTIDLDDGSSNFEIYNNLMLGSTLKLRDGFYRNVYNNIMVSAVPIGFHCWPQDNSEDRFERNITLVVGSPEGGRATADHLINPIRMPDDPANWGKFDHNLWWTTNNKNFKVAREANSLAEWQKMQGANSLFADPEFVDPLSRNYQVKATSPALKLGFKNFPMDQFGHQMTRIMGGTREFEGECNVTIRADERGGTVHYTLDGSTPTLKSTRYYEPFKVAKTMTLRAKTFDREGNEVGFADQVILTKVDQLQHQSWLASLLAGTPVTPAKTQKQKITSESKAKGLKSSLPFDWKGMKLVTISDFPDYIDASGGQTTGAYVIEIEQNSVAKNAGFQKGDTVIELNGKTISSVADLQKAIKNRLSKRKFKVFRGYEHFYLEL